MKLTKASIVAVGQFNPAIVTPGWLRAEKILTAEEAKVEQLVGATSAARRFQMEGFVWTVSWDRLVFERLTEDQNEACQPAEIVRALLGRLEHTPVRAIGVNFEFDGDEKSPALACAVGGRPVPQLAAVLGAQIAATHLQVVLLDDRGVQVQVNVGVEGDSPVPSVGLNFHRPVASAKEGVTVLEGAQDDLSRAENICRTMFAEAQ